MFGETVFLNRKQTKQKRDVEKLKNDIQIFAALEIQKQGGVGTTCRLKLVWAFDEVKAHELHKR